MTAVHFKKLNLKSFLFLTTESFFFLVYLLLLVEICEHRKASFASELGAAHDDGLTGCDGNI